MQIAVNPSNLLLVDVVDYSMTIWVEAVVPSTAMVVSQWKCTCITMGCRV